AVPAELSGQAAGAVAWRACGPPDRRRRPRLRHAGISTHTLPHGALHRPAHRQAPVRTSRDGRGPEGMAAARGSGRRFAFRLLAKLQLYRRLFLLERPLDEPLPPLSLPTDVTVARLERGDVSAYAAFRPEQGQATCECRWSRGDSCFATWRHGHIIGALWMAAGCALIDYLAECIR